LSDSTRPSVTTRERPIDIVVEWVQPESQSAADRRDDRRVDRWQMRDVGTQIAKQRSKSRAW
jgi:hypothetical protein